MVPGELADQAPRRRKGAPTNCGCKAVGAKRLLVGTSYAGRLSRRLPSALTCTMPESCAALSSACDGWYHRNFSTVMNLRGQPFCVPNAFLVHKQIHVLPNLTLIRENAVPQAGVERTKSGNGLTQRGEGALHDDAIAAVRKRPQRTRNEENERHHVIS